MQDDSGGPTAVVGGRYELGSLIGRGGAAAVHSGWDRQLRRRVAVKVVPLDVDPHGSSLARRRSEARLLASVSHPGLVTLYDAVTDEHGTCLVMELLEGGTLREPIAAGPMDPRDVAVVGGQLARALAHIHAAGIVHRDVKPANILLAHPPAEGPLIAKLSDFGIARLLETAPSGTTGVLGTARYLSPEQAQGRPAGGPSDVYSLGLTLLEALTGEPVFPGEALVTLTARLLRDPVVPASVGHGWRSLLTAMLARDPAARPAAQQVDRRIAALDSEEEPERTAALPATRLEDQGVPTTTPTVRIAPLASARPAAGTAPLPVAPPGRRRARRRIGAVLGVAAVLGAGALVPALVGAADAPTGALAVSEPSASPRASAAPSTRPSASVQPASGPSASTARSAATEQRASTVSRSTGGSSGSSGSASSGGSGSSGSSTGGASSTSGTAASSGRVTSMRQGASGGRGRADSGDRSKGGPAKADPPGGDAPRKDAKGPGGSKGRGPGGGGAPGQEDRPGGGRH